MSEGFNLKEASKTLMLLQENNLTDYEKLAEQAAASSKKFFDISDEIKVSDKRLNEINEMQKYISNYSRTRKIYKQYREAGYCKKFYEAHEAEIIIHKAAKKFFDEQKLEKLPSIKKLQQEYATLAVERKKLYQSYRLERENMKKLLTAKSNVDRILGAALPPKKSHEINRVER